MAPWTTVTKAGRLVVLAVRWELAIYRNAFRWVTRRYDVPAGSTPYPYVGAVSVLLWAFIIGSSVELVAFHFIIPWEPVRLAADVLGIWGVLWMVGLSGSLHVHPHLVTDEGLRIRNGHNVDVLVPWDRIATVRRRERSREKSRALQVDEVEGGPDVLCVVVASRTEIELVLSRPIRYAVRGTEREIGEIRFLAEDPRALVAEIERTRRAVSDPA